MARQSGNCNKCNAWRRSLHRDHIVPKYKGGGNEPENIQHLCANCHEEKTAEDMKGHPVSDEQKRAQSLAMTGRKLTQEHRLKLGTMHRGKKYKAWSDEARARVSVLRQKEIWTPERRTRHGLNTIKGQLRKAELELEILKEQLANTAQK